MRRCPRSMRWSVIRFATPALSMITVVAAGRELPVGLDDRDVLAHQVGRDIPEQRRHELTSATGSRHQKAQAASISADPFEPRSSMSIHRQPSRCECGRRPGRRGPHRRHRAGPENEDARSRAPRRRDCGHGAREPRAQDRACGPGRCRFCRHVAPPPERRDAVDPHTRPPGAKIFQRRCRRQRRPRRSTMAPFPPTVPERRTPRSPPERSPVLPPPATMLLLELPSGQQYTRQFPLACGSPPP